MHAIILFLYLRIDLSTIYVDLERAIKIVYSMYITFNLYIDLICLYIHVFKLYYIYLHNIVEISYYKLKLKFPSD